MLYKENWDAAKKRWDAYWKRSVPGVPLMHLVAEKDGARDPEIERALKSTDMVDKYQNPDRIIRRARYHMATHAYLADSFPNVSLDFGPGSMAAYLGSEITFSPDTIWFSECVDEWDGYPDLSFDPENKWYKKHIQLFKDAKALAGDDFYLCIPDIMENLDVLASLRGAQNTAYDLIDEPEEVERRVAQVQDLYYRYYDSFYDIVKLEEDGVMSSAYTCFQIWGRGKTLKLQCDYAAMMSPAQFRRFVQGALIRQCEGADHVLYHLDGPDAIRHIPALMEVEGIDALQWTSGSYNPDGTFEQWFPIYDAAVSAGKGIWVQIYNDGVDQWISRIDKLIRRYGSNCVYLIFPGVTMADADKILSHAEKCWKDIEGEVRPNA